MPTVVSLPDVLSQQTLDDGWQYRVRFPRNLVWFDGHFPDLPILPGVALIKITRSFLPEKFSGNEHFDIKKLKFQRLIRPDTELTLELRETSSNGMTFLWCEGEQQYAGGQFHF